MTANRRLAAILAADVVGYSRLMGEDEAGTAKAVREHREAATPIVRSHGGRIVKTMGDGVLLEFPSVVAAVECAIAIQKLMVERNNVIPEDKRILYRMGVHIGDVLVEGDDILGDGVNIAARLEGIAEPGGICVSGSTFEHVQGRVDADFTDLGDKSLKNIARPVRVYGIGMGATRSTEIASEIPKPTLALPDRPSIAVLPFQNISDDPEQEYFVDGMVEDIITGLSRIKWLFVIARNSSFVYKAKAVDVRQAGRELGVRYVLEGSVRKAGGRLRITVQLIEAETGAHLWADRFDGALQDVFDLQDLITEKVVGVVEPSLQRSEIERSRRKHPENLSAYDLYLRAVPHAMAITAPEAKIAIPLLERALKWNANYAAAHALTAFCHQTCYLHAGFVEADKLNAIRHARAAIDSYPDDATALAFGAHPIALVGKDYDTSLRAIERALSLNPSCAIAHFFGAQLNAHRGNPDVAIKLANRALRLSPFDRWGYAAHLGLGIAAVQQDRYDDACEFFAQGVQAISSLASMRFLHALALALAGRMDEAMSVFNRVREDEPKIGMRLALEIGLAPPILDKLAKGARMLGLRE
jgi:adenylate cyclase